MLVTLTTSDVAKSVCRIRMGEQLLREFHGSEEAFLAYVSALHERNNAGPRDVKAAWALYGQRSRP